MYSANVTVTDLADFVPLMATNIALNQDVITGNVTARSLKWYDCSTHCIYLTPLRMYVYICIGVKMFLAFFPHLMCCYWLMLCTIKRLVYTCV